MTITFKSKISNQSDEDQNIEFKALVNRSHYEHFEVFEFEEPSQKVMNRIEVSDDSVNIFAGPSTINMTLGKSVANEYQTPQGAMWFDAKLISLIKGEDKFMFLYDLSQGSNPFGTFEIELIINE